MSAKSESGFAFLEQLDATRTQVFWWREGFQTCQRSLHVVLLSSSEFLLHLPRRDELSSGEDDMRTNSFSFIEWYFLQGI